MHALELKHKELIERYLKRYPSEISEHTFTNLFIWRKGRPIYFIEANDSLILLAGRTPHLTIFGPPIGPISFKKALDTVRSETGKHILAIELIPESHLRSLKEAGLEPTEDRDNFDYVYSRVDMALLNGRKYHNKRNLIAQAVAEYDLAYERITEANLEDVIDMQLRWCADRRCKETPGLCREFISIGETLDNFDRLEVFGGAIRISGKIEAYTVAQRLNENTTVIHFEKASAKYKGLYQVINNLFAENALQDFEFINREQDLGIDGLRRAKESYFPHHMVKKYYTLLDISLEEYLKIRKDEPRC